MAVTVANLQNVEQKSANLRLLIQKKAIADAGTYTYVNPVSGLSESKAVSAGERNTVTNAYKAALAALKAAVQTLSE